MSNDWRKRLIALRDELSAVVETGQEFSQVVELDQTKVGRLSRMDALQAQAMAMAANDRREVTLKRIEVALRRIEDGEFGSCLRCDEAIDPKRLEFDPTVTLCIECARSEDPRQ